MTGTEAPPVPPPNLPPVSDRPGIDRFWDAYARGLVLKMTRHLTEGYSGEFLDRRARRIVRFAYPMAEVAAGAFDGPRFGLGIHRRLTDALAAVVGARLMDQETIPHRRQLDLVRSLLGEERPAEGSYAKVREQVLAELRQKSIAVEDVANRMEELLPKAGQAAEARLTGRLAGLWTEREVLLKAFALMFSSKDISRATQQVISNHRHEDGVTVGVAIWALGRHNRKSDTDYLLGLLREPALHRHADTIERALQFICSGPSLIPLAETTGAAADYWHGVLDRLPDRLPSTAERWAAHDAGSVFWEKRLRCAAQWSAANEHVQFLEPLRTDEVPAIRSAASPDGVGPSLTAMSDTELLAAVFRGNDAALTLFCKRSLPALLREITVYCKRAGLASQVTEELFSEALMRLVTRVRTRSADAAPVDNAVAWTKAIGRSVVFDYLGKSKTPVMSLDQIPEVAAEGVGHRPTAEDYEFMESYFAQLTPRQSEVMRLLFVEHLSVADVADRLQVTSDAVNKTLQRALKTLRELGFSQP